ncbi:MAG: TatD family hydrolase [Candidatus Heimdallarchaeum aukensis]|uniref:TatD family hydrolase n=1 Tax=Candidatus Heimdallarchaeum aukensis TaxID=2876573 RepID=A0A9Y1BIK0_9ARCH|nr:MAG: TatD family hydrolase [Candidatus Heimdallarchaeum aukensis]
MQFHDAHCHLPINYFYKDIDNFMKQWSDLGLEYVIGVSMKYTEIEKAIELQKKYKQIIPGFGIHPWKVKRNMLEEQINKISNYVATVSPLIFGEIGLDHHFIKKEQYYPLQEEVFSFFLTLSEKNSIPINVHSKGAEERVYELLDSFSIPPSNILIHWYSGPKKMLYKFRDKGVFFSINPSILGGSTHRFVLEEVGLEQLLTESDGNVKYWIKGEKIIGSPAIIPQIIEKIAEVKNLSIDEVSEVLSRNFKEFANIS